MEEPEERGSLLAGERSTLVSLKEFFDFLYIAYRISQELCDKDKDKDNVVLKKRIGWDELRENKLVARLLSVARSDLKTVTLGRSQPETKDGSNKTSTCTEVCNCQDCLYEFYESEEGVWSYSSTEECKNNEQPVGGLRVKINRKNHHWKRRSAIKQSSTNKTPLIKWVSDVLASMAAEVIDEGILDSVLPFIVPNACSFLKTTGNIDSTKRMISDKENLTMNRENIIDLKRDNEIDIQVCDEVKKSTKIFKCPQGVLLKKMKYFAGVTAGQKLEDMDISVHCDLSTFEWLMRWVKSTSKENLPTLSINNVIPVLVSAAFLLMEPLISECLMFLKQSIDEVIQTTPTLSCLNDRTLGRLSELMTNIEVESIKDKKDKIHSRLYCKMILNLAKKIPEPNRGHYSSITKLYRCVACDQLLHADYGRYISCCSDNLHVDNNGQLQSDHQLDPEWNLNEYIKGLKMELKTWRKVYWWLWGLCHYLNCSYCSAYYPVNRSHWCSYHPQPPQFPHDEHGENTSKIGKHMCCGEKSYRFEIFPSSSGCQYRSHSPRMDGHAEKIIMIVRKQESLICLPPPRLGYYDEIIKITQLRVEDKEVMKSKIIDDSGPGNFSLELLSKRTPEKLLAVAFIGEDCVECADPDKNDSQDPDGNENKVENLYDDFVQEYSSINMDSSSQSEEDDITDESTQNKGRIQKMGSSDYGKTCWPRREVYSERWIPKLPVRFNQDNLRDREERVVENFVKTLTRKGNELHNMPVKFHSHVQHIGRHAWSNFKNDTC